MKINIRGHIKQSSFSNKGLLYRQLLELKHKNKTQQEYFKKRKLYLDDKFWELDEDMDREGEQWKKKIDKAVDKTAMKEKANKAKKELEDYKKELKGIEALLNKDKKEWSIEFRTKEKELKEKIAKAD